MSFDSFTIFLQIISSFSLFILAEAPWALCLYTFPSSHPLVRTPHTCSSRLSSSLIPQYLSMDFRNKWRCIDKRSFDVIKYGQDEKKWLWRVTKCRTSVFPINLSSPNLTLDVMRCAKKISPHLFIDHKVRKRIIHNSNDFWVCLHPWKWHHFIPFFSYKHLPTLIDLISSLTEYFFWMSLL